MNWKNRPTSRGHVRRNAISSSGTFIAFYGSINYYATNYKSCGENFLQSKTLKADSHIAYRAHAVPLPCRAAKGLECVFPI